MLKIIFITFFSLCAFSFEKNEIISNVKKLKGSTKAASQLLCFYEKYKDAKFTKNIEIQNHNFLALQDFTLPSSQKRFFLINLKTSEVQAFYSAHGMGNAGDRNPFLLPIKFSNEVGSNHTPSGLHITSARENSRLGWKWIMRLDGIQKDINDNSRKRAIVFHPAVKSYDSSISTIKPGMTSSDELTPVLFEASYNGELLTKDAQGMSNGCTTLAKEHIEDIYDAIKNQGVIYNFTPREEALSEDYCGDNLLLDS